MMKSKVTAMVAILAVLTLSGSSIAFAATTDSSTADQTDKSAYSYNTGKEIGEQYANSDEETDKTDYSYLVGQENGAKYADEAGADESTDKSAFSFNTGKQRGSSYSQTDENTSEYSFNAGRNNAAKRNDIYEQLPDGGTKEDAEKFYSENDIGGGAWVNGEYDESAKINYGYYAGQQKADTYSQDTDDDEYESSKSEYSFSKGRQSYLENYENYTK